MSDCVGIAGPVCADRQMIFEASTDTSVDDHRDGPEAVSRCEEVAQEKLLKSLQEKFPQVSIRQKLGEGLPNSNSSCHSCDPSLSNGVKADVKHKSREADDGPKVDVDQESTGHQPNQHQVKASQNWQQTSYSQQPHRQPKPTVVDSLHQQQQWQRHIVNGGQYQQQAKQGAQLNRQQQAEGGVNQQLDHLSAQLRSVLDFSRLPSLEEALSPSGIVAAIDVFTEK